MFFRILKSSFLNRPKTVLLVIFSITLGTMVATAFLGIYREISGKMALELRAYGANILIEPAAGASAGVNAHLSEADLPKIRTVFWKHNIVGFAPYLYGVVELSTAARHERGVLTGTWFNKTLEVEGEEPSKQGVKVVAPWWDLQGNWPRTADQAVIGASLAKRLGVSVGDEVVAVYRGERQAFHLAGVVTTGGYEEEQLFAPLAPVQSLLALPGKISRIQVSAMTVPMDAFGKRDPATMSKQEYEKWYCTAYVTSVAKNIQEVVTGGSAKPVWRIADAEGALLKKLNLVMLLLTAIALISASVAVSTTLMASMSERRRELALMKSLGADRLRIVAIFLGEAVALALFGGIAGYLAGVRLAQFMSRAVFDSSLQLSSWLLAISLVSALVVALLGSIPPVRRGLLVEPIRGLKG